MANGDNHQQWGYAHFTQSGQATGQAGNFMNQQGFDGNNGHNISSTNAFTLPQQWQPQDNQFIHDNGFSSFQPQGSSYPVQHLPENTGHAHTHTQAQAQAQVHAQSHQHPHPQTYSAPISLDNPPDMPWEYDFGFDSNPLTGMGDNGIPYGSSGGLPQQNANSNGLPSTSSFAQGLPNTIAGQQQQFSAATSSGNTYPPSQSAGYGRPPQQSPPQAMAQPAQSQRHVMEYQQPPLSQQQQAQPSVTQPHPQHPQHPQPAAQYQQPSHQHQHRQSHPLQTASPQPNQLQNIHHFQQAPRIGTPQSVTPATQPSQSPFQGRNVPPFSMQQQQTQLAGPDGRGSPAIPFSAPQQNNVQTTVARASPNLANSQTSQSRFVPQQLMPIQQSLQGPVPPPSKASNVVPNTQQQNMQPNFQAGIQTNLQPKTNMAIASAAPPQLPVARGLAPPRVLHHDDQRCPMGSRYVAISAAPALSVGEDAVANNTVSEIPDPNQVSAQPFGRLLPPGQGGQTRTLAFEALRRWTKAVEQDDVAVQNEWEQRLRKYLGGELPKYYEDKLVEARAARKKASGSQGPERSKTRPKDEADAAEWEALGIVYLENPQPTGAEIGEAVAAYGKLIRQHSAEFQKLKQKLKVAKEAESDGLKDQVARKLEVIHRAVAAANAWGDAQVVANLGGNQKLISDFVSILIHANNSGDHNGKAPKAVLRLLSGVTTIEKDFLMSSLQFAKISKKFETKGDAEVKGFVQKIKENAESRKDKPENDEDRISTPDPTSSVKGLSGLTGTTDPPKKKFAGTAATRVPSASSFTKRPREEEADTKSAKRLAADPTTAQPGQKTAPTKIVVPAPVVASTGQSKLFGNGGLLGAKKTLTKATPKAVPARTDGVKSETSTTKPEVKKEPLKKPDTTKARKTEPVKTEAPFTSKLGGISALLDSISKPKPAGRSTPDKEAKVEKDETPEEKERRLRKEKRRHLRVSFKEGDELTEVRIFHKDVDEDEGRAGNMIRDARDDRSEGMVLKQGLQSGAQEEDDDEEDDLPYRPWFQPTGVDFALIPQERREKSFVTRGGQLEFETQQQRFIIEREEKELMVVYTDPSDIPPTPTSPHPQLQEDTDMHTGSVHNLVQDEPKLAEIHLRWAEANSRGLSWARLNALRRAQKGQTSPDAANMHGAPAAASNGAASHAHQAQPMSREDQALALLASGRVKNWQDPDPYDPADPKTQRRYDYVDPEVQRAADLIETAADQLKGKTAPPTEPPEWMQHDSARVAEWWHGYKKDKQREEQRAQQQMISMQANQPPAAVIQPQTTSQAQAVQSAADPNAAAWAAYYAQIQQQQQQQQGQAHNMDPNAVAWAAYYTQQQQQPQAIPAQPTEDSNAQLQAVLAALGATPAPAQQQPAAQDPTDPQLQALLASLGAGATAQQPAQGYQAQPAAAQFQAPNANDPDYLNYIMSLAGAQAADQGQQQQQALMGNGQRRDDSRERALRDRDRNREVDGAHASRRAQTQNRNNKGGNRDAGVPPHMRGINREKIGTKPCTFYSKGLCQKGDKCTFRHD